MNLSLESYNLSAKHKELYQCSTLNPLSSKPPNPKPFTLIILIPKS